MFIQFQHPSQLQLHSKESLEETVSWRKLFERLYRLALIIYLSAPDTLARLIMAYFCGLVDIPTSSDWLDAASTFARSWFVAFPGM
jgi:hypothetical protein